MEKMGTYRQIFYHIVFGQNIENQQLAKEMNQNYTNIFGVF